MPDVYGLFALEALNRLLAYKDAIRILDIGCGNGEQAEILRVNGRKVTTIAKTGNADFIGDYLDYEAPEPFDAIWASHVLEHMPNVNLFLKKCFRDLRDDGVLAITVPPFKSELVGGHLTLWTSGLLIYNLIIAGFDCSKARVSSCYANGWGQPPYNLSVIVRKKAAELPALFCDAGDIELLAKFFPCPVSQNVNGCLPAIRW